MKIKGIPVATPAPRPDWNQTDPTKADYIRNKPNDLLHGTDTSLSASGRAADAKATGEALKKLSADTGEALTKVDNRITAVGEAVEDKAGVYKVVTGDRITIEDAPDSVLHGLKLYGKSEQFTTTGAQLANTTEPLQNPGIVIITGQGKRVEVKNTSAYVHAQFALSLSPNTDYVLSYKTNLVSGQYNARIIGIDGNGVETAIITSAAMPMVFNSGEYGSWKVAFYATTELSSNPVYENIMVNTGSTAKPWEPYTGGKPSPSPEYPQEIVSAGQDGDIGVKVCGAQLAPLQDVTFTNRGLTWTSQNGAVRVVGIAESTTSSNGYIFWNFTGMAGTFFVSGSADSVHVLVAAKKDGKTSFFENRSFVLDGTEEDVWIYCQVYDAGTKVDTTLYPMLNVGTTALPWEPYKPIQTLTALTPNGLPGIKVNNGGNWTDSTGQQWVGDVIDLGRGKRLHRFDIYTFTGDETFSFYSGSSDCLPLYRPAKTVLNGECLCKPLTPTTIHSTLVSTDNTVSCRQNGIVIHFAGIQGVGTETYPGWGELGNAIKAKLKELADAGTPLTVAYQLAEPYETDLTEDDLSQFGTLRTYSPITSIFNDESVGMEVSYYLPKAALPVSGGTMGGNINMGNHRIVGLCEPLGDTDAVSKGYVNENFVADLGYREAADNTMESYMAVIEDCLRNMPGDSVRHVSIHSSGRRSVTIHKHLEGYADIEEISYAMALSGAAYYYKRVRSMYNGVWLEWEHENPPMRPGSEYRTTERYNGKAVYVQLVDFGTLPNSVPKSVEVKTSRLPVTNIVSYETLVKTPDPFVGHRDVTLDLSDGYMDISMFAEGDESNMTAKVLIKYTLD